MTYSYQITYSKNVEQIYDTKEYLRKVKEKVRNNPLILDRDEYLKNYKD